METCRAASISPDRIDKVLLTGGTAQIPYIQAFIEKIFAPEKIMRPGFFSSVASGLGHIAAAQ
jgi:molecular chaperone DnaK (HSP70)